MGDAMTIDTVIFDLDGTLVDTAPDLCSALNHVMEQIGRPAIDLCDVRHMVGLGAKRLIEQGLTHTRCDKDTPLMDEMLDLFMRHYAANIAKDSLPFPGAVTLLETLKANGLRLGICTNKPQTLTEQLLEALKLDHYFQSVIGGDVPKNKKPHQDHLLAVLQELEAQPSRSAMIGDTQTDLEAARAACVPVILVRFGYSPVTIDELGPDLGIDHFDEVFPLLSKIEKVAHSPAGAQI